LGDPSCWGGRKVHGIDWVIHRAGWLGGGVRGAVLFACPALHLLLFVSLPQMSMI